MREQNRVDFRGRKCYGQIEKQVGYLYMRIETTYSERSFVKG